MKVTNFHEFFRANPVNKKFGVVLGGRFGDSEFICAPITGTQQNNYLEKAMTMPAKGAKDQGTKFSIAKYYQQIILNHCIEPNFKLADEIKAAGVHTAEQYIDMALNAGEQTELANKILDASGLSNNQLEEDVEIVKN